jgi:hypothetical protein
MRKVKVQIRNREAPFQVDGYSGKQQLLVVYVYVAYHLYNGYHGLL